MVISEINACRKQNPNFGSFGFDSGTFNLSGRTMGLQSGRGANVNKILEIVDLVNRKDDRIKTFSGGMKRRINIACSLLHNPRILSLDEPTVGVDPQNRNHIFEVIERFTNELNDHRRKLIFGDFSIPFVSGIFQV
jgi:energy-coupling factor transporter ATP-binding protein EcfA2